MQVTGSNTQNKKGMIISSVYGAGAVSLAPLIYRNGIKEYKNRNVAKLACGACITAATCSGFNYIVNKVSKQSEQDTSSKQKLLKIFFLVLTAAIMAVGFDFWAAKNRSNLKTKLKQYADDVIDIITDLDLF